MEETINLLTLICGKEVLLKTSSFPEKIIIEIQSKNKSNLIGKIYISELDSKAKELEKTLKELENDVRQALAVPKPDNKFVYEVVDDKFYLKKDLGVCRLNFLEVSLEQKSGDIFDIFRVLISKNNQLKVELADKVVEYDKFKIKEREMRELIEKLKEDKEKFEKENKQRFLALLNSKKRKIDELLKKNTSKSRQLQILSTDDEHVSEKLLESDCDTDDEIQLPNKKPRIEAASSFEDLVFTRNISTNSSKAIKSSKSDTVRINPTRAAKSQRGNSQTACSSKIIQQPKEEPTVNLNDIEVDHKITDLDNDQMVSSESKPVIDTPLLFDDDLEIPCSPLPNSPSIFTRTPTSDPRSPYKFTKKVKRTPETIMKKKLRLEKAQSTPILSQHGPFSIDTQVLAIDDFLN